jgi:aminomethyltransferase
VTEGDELKAGFGPAFVALGDWNERARSDLPLDHGIARSGARMVPFAGYQMPIQYEASSPSIAGRASRRAVRRQPYGQILLTGTGWTRRWKPCCPRDLSILKDGRLRYSLLLNDMAGSSTT